jgi:hypothetical protein
MAQEKARGGFPDLCYLFQTDLTTKEVGSGCLFFDNTVLSEKETIHHCSVAELI